LVFFLLEIFSQHGHQIKLFRFQVDSLALQVVVHDPLLLADDFGAARDLLQQDLHHVHLANGQAVHLRQSLRDFRLVLRRLQLAQFRESCVCRICGFAPSQDFAHLPRVEAQHRVLLELEALIDLVRSDL